MTTAAQPTTEIEFSFHSLQREVFESLARFKVVVAGRRFGKTLLALMTLVIKALQKKDGLFWYVSPSYRQSKMIAWKMLKKIVPEFLIIKTNESELSIMLKTGSTIELKGADNEDALRGAGLDGMVIDEFASIYDNWSVWNEVLRPALADKKGWVLFIGTPKGKDSFFELYTKGQRKEDGFESWQFITTDNPYIDPAEIESAKKSMPSRYFRQEFEASFEDFQGLIFPEFNEKRHVIHSRPIEPRLNRVGAIDTAITGTTGCLKGTVDSDGTLVIYEEYYEKDKRVDEVVREIKEEDITWYIDPAAVGQKIQKSGKIFTLFDEYLDHGIHALYAEKDVNGGINRVAEMFKTGKIKIFDKCINLIWELERYHWSEHKETVNGIPKAAPFKKNDHLVDCLRYLVMSREVTSPQEKKGVPGLFSPAYDWDKPKEETFI